MPSELVQFEFPGAAESEDDANLNRLDVAAMDSARVIPFEYAAAELPQAVPVEMLLGSVRDGRLRVIAPIRVKIIVENGHIILEAVGLDEFAYGENLSEAIVDLQRTLAELYLTLETDEDRLGADLKQTLQNLRAIIKRV